MSGTSFESTPDYPPIILGGSGDVANSPTWRYSTAADMVLEYNAAYYSDVKSQGNYFTAGLPFRLFELGYENPQQGETVAVVVGTHDDLMSHPDGPLIRMHSACIFSELGIEWAVQQMRDPGVLRTSGGPFSITRPCGDCDCRAQRLVAQRVIAEEGGIYFDLSEQEARNGGQDDWNSRIALKIAAYKLHAEEGLDTVDAYKRLGVPFDTRDYGHCARFLLEDLGIDHVRLLSNNPGKIDGLSARGIRTTPVEHVVGVNEQNIGYLETKRDKAGHRIPSILRFTNPGM
jgi:GTP cyclohydrolase II